MGAFAWVTLATNDSYSLGALVLAHSLKQAGTAHQLAVLVTPGVTSAMRDKLATVFNVVQEVNILDSRDEANLRLLKRPELGITFTKLHCWQLTQFEKCVFLDADTLVLQNADELFEREELSAAPDVGWPDCFNSGVFVYRPSLDTYDKLIQFALEKGSFDGGDQGLLNLFFADWAHKDITKHLPFIYNVCSTACYSYLPAFKQFGGLAKIIHFIGTQKPWLQYFNTETRRVQPSGDSSHLQDVLQRWWDIFCSLIHPHLSPAMQGQSQHGMSPSYVTPQYDPPPHPTASADDFENAWDPWDEYDQKIARNTHTSEFIHHQSQPHHSPNTNASRVANQPIRHSQPQSHNYNTNSVQNNSYYQPPPSQEFHYVPRLPSPSPIVQQSDLSESHSHSEPQYHQSEPCHHESQHHHSEPDHHEHKPQYHHSEPHLEPEYHHSCHESQYFHVESTQRNGHGSHSSERQHYESYSHDHHSYNNSDSVRNHESYSHTPERPKSPNRPDQFPVLPKECEATTTVSNEMSLSSTVEDYSKQEDAGLAGAFSQLTLGVARTPEQDVLDSILRKQAWEVGNIDYLGRDSFENIWSKISETLSAAPPPLQVSAAAPPPPESPTPSPPQASATPPESEKVSAPAESQSQSQTALQEEASSVQPQAAPIISPSSTTDTSKVDSFQSSSSAQLKEQQVPETPVVTASDQAGPAKTGTVTESTAEVSKEPSPLISTGEIVSTEETKSETAQVLVEQKPSTEPLTCTVPSEETKTPGVKASELQPTAQQLQVETSAPQSDESKQSAATASQQPVQSEVAPAKEKVDISQSSSVSSEPSTVTSPPPIASSQISESSQSSTTSPPTETSASSDTSSPVGPPAAEKTVESITEPKAAVDKKASPKTKVTEPTPPATPDAPPAEKTKQTAPVGKAKEALTAEATVPVTPPPTEGGSTPTPPPRKTDKPKKAAAKAKK